MLRLIALLAVGQAEDSTVLEFYDLIRAVVAFARTEIGAGSDRSLADAPLLLNLEAISVLGTSATRTRVSQADVARALGVAVRSVNVVDAIRCSHVGTTAQECDIRERSVHLDFNGLLYSRMRAETIITVRWSQRTSRLGYQVGMAVLRLTLARSNGHWTVQRRVIEART